MSRKKSHPKGMGGTYERGGKWYIRFTWEGRDYRESSNSPRKGDATNLLKERIRQMRDGTFQPGGAKIKLCDLRGIVVADCERNGRKYVGRVGQCFDNLERLIGAETRARDIDANRLDTYAQKRLAETIGPTKDKDGNAIKPRHVARGTVNRELACLKRAFRLAIQKRRIAIMPHVAMLTEENVRTRVPSDDEVAAVMRELPDGLRSAVLLLSVAPWRVREALNLAWRSVDERAGEIRQEAVEYKSGREARVLPYAAYPALADMFAERRQLTDDWQREHGAIVEHVFWYAGEDANGQPAALPYSVYAGTWARACKRAKVAGLNVHDLKRYATNALTGAGVDEKTIMRLAGWRSRSMFDRYSIRNNEDVADGMRKLAQAAQERAAAARTRQA